MNITCSSRRMKRLIVNGGKVSAQIFGHGESFQPVGTEELGHFLIRDKVLLVLGILEIVILDVGPKVFHALSSGSFVHSNHGG